MIYFFSKILQISITVRFLFSVTDTEPGKTLEYYSRDESSETFLAHWGVVP